MTLTPSSSSQLTQNPEQQRQLDLTFMQRAFELAQQAEQHD